MPLPSTPEELARAIASLDREIMQLDREIQQRASDSADLPALLDRRERARRDRVGLQFFVESSPAAGRKPRDPEAMELPTRRSGCGRPIAVLVVLAAAGGAGYMMVSRPRSAPLPTSIVEVTVTRSASARKPDASGRTAPLPASAGAASRPGASAGHGAESLPERSAQVEWHAKVRSAQGLQLAPQSACTLSAKLRVQESDKLIAEPKVVCGTQTLYSADEAAQGLSRRTSRFWERSAAPAGAWEHWLQYSDLGARSESLNIKIDTPAGRVVLWRDTQPAVRLELEVDRWAKRQGEALFTSPVAEPTDFETVERKGRIVTATGVPPEPANTACTFRLAPNSGGHNCRAFLQCASSVLYGKQNQGYLDCDFVEGLPTTALDSKDSDGDPTFDMNLATGRLVTSTLDPAQGYKLTIMLEP